MTTEQCKVTDCPYYDKDVYWKCSKYIKISDCYAIPLINNRELQKTLLKEKIKRLEHNNEILAEAYNKTLDRNVELIKKHEPEKLDY